MNPRAKRRKVARCSHRELLVNHAGDISAPKPGKKSIGKRETESTSYADNGVGAWQ
jgi:hypothetical protein